MPCLLALVVLLFPRVTILVLFLFTGFFERAFHSLLLLLIGFLFLPLTTLLYAWLVNTGQPVEGIYLIAMILAVVLDVGSLGGGEYSRRRR